MKTGTRITIRNAPYEVVHAEEASPRTQAFGIVRAITLKPETGNQFFIGLERRDGSISALAEIP